jgi:hypothetical protein
LQFELLAKVRNLTFDRLRVNGLRLKLFSLVFPFVVSLSNHKEILLQEARLYGSLGGFSKSRTVPTNIELATQEPKYIPDPASPIAPDFLLALFLPSISNFSLYRKL